MSEGALTDAEVRRRALEALVARLGPADALRFLRQLADGKGDYTAERAAWLDPLRLDEIVADIVARRPAA